jgi:hypothetical protein
MNYVEFEKAIVTESIKENDVLWISNYSIGHVFWDWVDMKVLAPTKIIYDNTKGASRNYKLQVINPKGKLLVKRINFQHNHRRDGRELMIFHTEQEAREHYLIQCKGSLDQMKKNITSLFDQEDNIQKRLAEYS